jgi:hypothetical protein
MSKDLMSLLVSSCLSVWSGYVHLLFCTKSLDSKFRFQVPSSRGYDPGGPLAGGVVRELSPALHLFADLPTLVTWLLISA